MATYVDELRPVRPDMRFRMKSTCHLMADSDGELERMARRLGLEVDWRHGDHYDLSPAKRARAVIRGAHAVLADELVRLRQRKRITAHKERE